MTFIQRFAPPVREMLIGNLLLLICSLLYLAWWAVSYWPNTYRGLGGVFLIMALFAGIAAIIMISGAIHSLSRDSKGSKVRFIWLGFAALFCVLLVITSSVFQRIVTSELAIIHVWAALELSAAVVLYETGYLEFGRTAILSLFVATATVIGLICYVIYYRLGAAAAYWTGMIPLIVDAVVMVLFLWMLASSSSGKA